MAFDRTKLSRRQKKELQQKGTFTDSSGRQQDAQGVVVSTAVKQLPTRQTGPSQDLRDLSINLANVPAGKGAVNIPQELPPEQGELPQFVDQQPTVATPVDPLQQLDTERERLQGEISTLEGRLANTGQAAEDAFDAAGVFDSAQALNKSRARLQELEDRRVEIPIDAKQQLRGRGATKRDLQNLTGQALEDNALETLAQARSVQAQSGALETNIAAVQARLDADNAALEFEYEQKNTRLNAVISAHSDIITEEQKLQLEERKHENELERDDLKLTAQYKADIQKMVFQSNLNMQEEQFSFDLEGQATAGHTALMQGFADSLNGSPSNQTEALQRLIDSGAVSPKEGLDMKIKINAESVRNQEGIDKIKNNLEQNQLVRTKISQLLSDRGQAGLEDISVGNDTTTFFGAFQDRTDFTGFLDAAERGKKFLGFTDAAFADELIKEIQAPAVLEGMASIKGPATDKDAEIVRNAITEISGTRTFDENLKSANNMLQALDRMDLILNAQLEEKSTVGNPDQMIQNVESMLQSPQASAQIEGYPQVNLSKLIEAESKGSYTAVNPTSGAFGKYQFIPSTLQEYANKTGQTVAQAKTPAGQERMFAQFTQDNISFLEKYSMPVNTFTVYAAHQQGANGFMRIAMNNLIPSTVNNMYSNIPHSLRAQIPVRADRSGQKQFSDPQLVREVWLDHWSNIMA